MIIIYYFIFPIFFKSVKPCCYPIYIIFIIFIIIFCFFRYFYQPNDLVKYNNKIYTIKGTHNNGTRAILRETGKSIKVGDLIPYRFSKGFYFKVPSENK